MIKTKTTIGSQTIDCFLSDAQEYLYSLTSAADLLDKAAQSASDYLNSKAFKAKFPDFQPTKYKYGNITYSLVPNWVITEYLTHHANSGNPIAIQLLYNLAGGTIAAPTAKPKSISPEKQIQLKLQQQLGGDIEVSTAAGKIDLLTSTEVIEIKKVCNWKAAIGQVIVYGFYYPSHTKRIHLFGKYHRSFREMVELNCDKAGVAVTWES